MKKFYIIGVSALALAACENVNQPRAQLYSLESAPLAAVADFAPDLSQKRVLQESGTELVNGREVAVDSYKGADPAGVYLAYRYGYGLVMPSAAIKSTADKHMQICRDAGPSKCQITGSNTQTHSKQNIRANLSLRAEPKWLESFVAQMKLDIADIKGRVESENTSVEDLTRAILDTDARLKAKLVLRTRLENLLETRDAKLADLLSLERELARVQAEIESATANLKALQARISMSVVNINYTSERLAVSRSSISPIGRALKDFVSILSGGVAGVINFFAYLLPWFIFVILPGFFVGRWFFRTQRRKTNAKLKSEEKHAEIKINQA